MIWNFYSGFLGFFFYFVVFLYEYDKFDIKNYIINIFYDWLEKISLKKEEKIRKLLDKFYLNIVIIVFKND